MAFSLGIGTVFFDKDYIKKPLIPAVVLSGATLAPAAFAQKLSGQTSFHAHSCFAFDLARVDALSGSGVQDVRFTNLNAALGHQFHPSFSSELWASLSSAGEKDRHVGAELGQRVDAEYNSFGVFGIAKTSTSPYLSSRLGLASVLSQKFVDENA